MTAQSQTRPMPGAMPQPYAPAVEEIAPRTKGTNRSARIALILSLLVATGGVSFAIGRMSVDEAAIPAGSPMVMGALPAAGSDGIAAASTVDDSSGAASTSSSTGSGPGQAPALAAATVDDTDTVPQLEDTLAAEAGAPPARSGEMMVPGAGRPGGSGGAGGVQGTVAEITLESLTVTTADGSSQTFAIDGTTSWLQQETIAAADVQSGDAVSVQLPFAGPGGESGDGSTSTLATQVTVTTPAA